MDSCSQGGVDRRPTEHVQNNTVLSLWSQVDPEPDSAHRLQYFLRERTGYKTTGSRRKKETERAGRGVETPPVIKGPRMGEQITRSVEEQHRNDAQCAG